MCYISVASLLALLPAADQQQCGIRNKVPLVVGGSEAADGEFPWMAKLEIASGGETALCGASLIDEEWLLTAAHCLPNNLIGIRITLGRRDFMDLSEEAHEQHFTTDEFYIHPKFLPFPLKYDFALIRLPESALFNQYVTPICLPKQIQCDYSSNETVIDGCDAAQASGWGATETSAEGSEVLKKVQLPLVALSACQKVPSYRNDDLGSDVICAGGLGDSDTCIGDSGGPLGCITDNQQATLLGLVSYGNSCGAVGVPGIYARVCSALGWISEIRRLNNDKPKHPAVVWAPGDQPLSRCNMPQVDDNTFVFFNDGSRVNSKWINPGYRVGFRCKDGFKMESGDAYFSTLCGQDLNWQPSISNYSKIACFPVASCDESMLPNITNGFVVATKSDPPFLINGMVVVPWYKVIPAQVGSTRPAFCNINPVKQAFEVVCNSSGMWSMPVNRIECPEFGNNFLAENSVSISQ